MRKIEEITDKKVWEIFIQNSPLIFSPFFQSWDWGELQTTLGNTIFRFGLFHDKTLIGVCQAVAIKAKRGRYLHLRHGPILPDFEDAFDDMLEVIKEQARALKLDFIRMSPLLDTTTFERQFLKDRGFRNAAVHNMDAENTWVLDLDKSEEELLAGMRKTTRYLVKKAQGIAIEINVSTSEEDFDEFLTLYKVTSQRHSFVPHRGLREELVIFAKNNNVKLFLARYEGKLIAGAMVIFYGNQAVYHHAASDTTYRDIPAAYLLQWEAIKEAKRQKKALYNFWGIVPPEKTKHPWQGLTLFKTGFGGRRVNFIHAQDLPLTPGYWKTYLIETAWRIKKGY